MHITQHKNNKGKIVITLKLIPSVLTKLLISKVKKHLVISGSIFTIFLYVCGVIVFNIKSEAYYFLTQFFILLIFFSIGITIVVTEYSLANVKRINVDVSRLLNVYGEKKESEKINFGVSWLKILPISVFFGFIVDSYIYLTEIKKFSVLSEIYIHVYEQPLLYHYFLLVGFIAGFVGGRAGYLGYRYISYTYQVSNSEIILEQFRLMRIMNRPRKIKEIHELIQIAFKISIGGLMVIGMAAYFILIAAQIVDPLSISILIVAVVIALGFFILPQVRLSKVVKKVKEKMLKEVYAEFGLDAEWFVKKKQNGFDSLDAANWKKEKKKISEQLDKLNNLQKHEFHALTSHLDYIEEIQEWPLDYKWFIAEFAIALIPFFIITYIPR